MKKAKFYSLSGLQIVELNLDIDGIRIVSPHGEAVTLSFRRSDEQISIDINGRMAIHPVSSNVIRLSRINDSEI